MNGQEIDESVYSNLIDGTYSFHYYASACWAMHLQEGISELKIGAELTQLLESLETFIEIHWSPTHKPLQDLKRVRVSLDSVKKSEYFEKIIYAVGWAKRQSSKYGQGPSPDDALDLWQVTKKVRSVLEDAQPSDDEEEKLRRFYGLHRFNALELTAYAIIKVLAHLSNDNTISTSMTDPFFAILWSAIWKWSATLPATS
ncbi:hypothetical protein F5B21DRAFT_498886 [Xylaria acuta]|nr:hypothetical protein F5B21DRAFT_498886 [Xylaria acuta]